MNRRKCIKCASLDIVKNGFQNKIQVYKCISCKTKFQRKKRKHPPLVKDVFFLFLFRKQTLKELSLLYHTRTITIQKSIDEYVLPKKIHNPRKIWLLVDGVYFSGKEAFCLVVFRDIKTKEDIWWKFCDTETESVYREGKIFLESLGYIICSVTADGLALIRSAFKGIPYQMCQVHMRRIVIRSVTLNPELEQGQVLSSFSKLLFKTNDRDYFINRFKKYYELNKEFINEKAISTLTGKDWFVHKYLKQGFDSMYRLLPHLFTYLLDRKNIPKNTNSLEGHFKHLRIKLSVHHGLSLDRKQKLLTAILLNSSSTKLKKE